MHVLHTHKHICLFHEGSNSSDHSINWQEVTVVPVHIMNEWIGEDQKTSGHNFIWNYMLTLTTIKVMLKFEPGIHQIWRRSISILIAVCPLHILCTNIHIQCIHKLCIQKRFTVLCDTVWWLSVCSRLLAAVSVVRSTLTWTAAWVTLWATVGAVLFISVEPALQTHTELVPPVQAQPVLISTFSSVAILIARCHNSHSIRGAGRSGTYVWSANSENCWVTDGDSSNNGSSSSSTSCMCCFLNCLVTSKPCWTS